MKKTLQAFMAIVDSANLAINEKDLDYLTGMMNQVSKEVTSKDAALKQELEKLQSMPQAELIELIAKLTENMTPDQKSTVVGKINQQQGGKHKKQSGGFVRDFSRFPQAFYELDAAGTSDAS